MTPTQAATVTARSALRLAVLHASLTSGDGAVRTQRYDTARISGGVTAYADPVPDSVAARWPLLQAARSTEHALAATAVRLSGLVDTAEALVLAADLPAPSYYVPEEVTAA